MAYDFTYGNPQTAGFGGGGLGSLGGTFFNSYGNSRNFIRQMEDDRLAAMMEQFSVPADIAALDANMMQNSTEAQRQQLIQALRIQCEAYGDESPACQQLRQLRAAQTAEENQLQLPDNPYQGYARQGTGVTASDFGVGE